MQHENQATDQQMLKNPDFCVIGCFLQITDPEEIRLHIHEANSRIDMGMALKCVLIMITSKYLSKMVVRSIQIISIPFNIGMPKENDLHIDGLDDGDPS